jgi:peptidoglycan/LPS O-acetylase OafA/YrhL
MTRPPDRKQQLHGRLVKLIWLDRFRRLRPALYVLVPILVLGSAFWLDPQRPGDKLRGTMTGIVTSQSDTGTSHHITFTLDSGGTFALSGAPKYREGARVVVQEYVTRFLGRRTYRFVSFEETQ